jgi:hypothetical protein
MRIISPETLDKYLLSPLYPIPVGSFNIGLYGVEGIQVNYLSKSVLYDLSRIDFIYFGEPMLESFIICP